MILVIDNYDSFVYNLVQYLGKLGKKVEVYRNDEIGLKEIEKKAPEAIVISPGPGRPKDAGISKEVIEHFAPYIPILGVCLGHQCIGEVFGAKVVLAKNLMHGKTSLIYHNEEEIYQGIENPFVATRYHSLIIKNDSLPDCLVKTAWTEEDEIMGIRHKEYPVFGMQFHPESILTRVGEKLLRNFIKLEECIHLKIWRMPRR
ncbi:anthranilate/aminodeoxychorismate synthase component II [Candidatus Aerophobetes bacterium]|uniref:Anthranilate/aminodeoxychorismate synthase component II n=1 Tax=Aerophobetes bacterium TaxID=2030807 RepID=A0A497E5I8_UNCAE|nr:MAG: anthranilate/aminodeoxychorismate synthase component II [Candidatus Aerophobetes bacterium]